MTIDTFNGIVEWRSKWAIVKVKQKKEDVETEIEFLTTGVTREQVYVDWETAVKSIQNFIELKPITRPKSGFKKYKIVKDKDKDK